MTFKVTVSFPVDTVNARDLEDRLKLAGMSIDRADAGFGVIHGFAEQLKINGLTAVEGVAFVTSHGHHEISAH